MAKPLDSAQAKLERAHVHLYAFYTAYRQIFERDPIRFSAEGNTKSGSYVVKLDYVPLLTPNLSVILGDVLHNFRTCLDHLVWQLALLTTDKPDRNTQFPITKDEREFRGQCYRIADLRPEDQTIIQQFQGHDRGDYSLRRLNRYINQDKHRTLVTMIVRHYMIDPVFLTRNASLLSVEILSDVTRLDVGTEIARLKLGNIMGEPEVYVQGHFVPEIAFEDGRDAISVLLDIGAEIVLCAQAIEDVLEPRPFSVPPLPRRPWPNFSVWPPL